MLETPVTRPVAPYLPVRGATGVREGIAAVAVDLFLERGFVETTIDDIAIESGISRRTYFRYFATKDDTILEYLVRLGDAFVEHLLARPPGEKPLRATQAAIYEVLDETTRDTAMARALSRLILETPALRARQLAMHNDWQCKLGNALAVRTGLDGPDMRCQIIAGVASIALDIGAHRWTYSASGRLPDYVDEVIEAIRAERKSPVD
jgi:AcrR family transcriptional regulator